MYPALAVIQEKNNNPNDAILWVGAEGGMEEALVKQAGLNYAAIPAAGIHGVSLRALPGNILKLWAGFFASLRILRKFKPDVLFFTGGYTAVPMALAGIRCPQLLFVPDIEPGLALKALTAFADAIAVVTDQSRQYFPKKKRVVISGYPTRSGLQKWSREEAKERFSLSPVKPVLFVFGGSKGARSINRAITANLEKLLTVCQIIHITGEPDWEEVQQVRTALDPAIASDYHITPYLHEEMGAAFSAADLVLSRAGASTLGELPLFGLPAILVPYPYAWRYQKVNAEYLVSQNAAIMLRDEEIGQRIGPIVTELMANREKLNQMKKAMRELAVPDAARNIALLLEELSVRKRK